MNRNRSRNIIYSVIILVVCFYAFLTGCGGSSGKNPTMVYYNGDSGTPVTPQTQTIKVNITNNGKVYSTTSPSGKMTLEAPEENTYDSDVLLKITESPSVGNESNLLTVGSIIYGVTATKDGSPINLLNHPLNLTFSNEEKLNGAESYYIGIKDINGGDWQFVNVYSPNLSARASIDSKNQFTYSIYKNNILVALFADIRNILQSTPKVLGVIATLTPSIIPAENAVYTEDLKVNLLLSGENLSGLSADSFKIKVSYLTSDSRDTALKVDGTAVSHIYGSGTNQHGTSGQSYAHQFQFVPLNTKYSAGFAPAITFDINLKDVALSGFPNNFIVEISSNKANSLPFAYSTFLGFTRTGSGTETETNTNTNTNTNTDTNTDTKAVISLKSPATDFPVEGSKVELEFSEDIAWNDADKAKITIDNNAVINDYSYSNKVLSLTFKDRLAYNTTYVLNVTDLTGVENATLVFKTANIGTVALKSDATDFQVSNNKIELEFSNDIPWSMTNKDKISIDNDAEISDYSYSNKVLTLTLRQRLKFDSTYLIKVTGLESIENNTFVLKTEENAETSLKTASDNFSVNGTIEVEFSKDIFFDNEEISKLIINNDAEIVESSYANKVLGLKLKGKLNYDTLYTIIFNGVNGVVPRETISFKTEKLSVTPVISLSKDSIKENLNGRTVLQPVFFINFGKAIASSSLALNNIKLNGANLPEDCTLEFDADLQNAVLKFGSNLEEVVDYTLSINTYTDDDKSIINYSKFDFKTMPPEEITGEGTLENPYLIYTEAHLRKIKEMDPINYRCGQYFFKQMDDIIITGDWTPIGDDYGYSDSFNGNYDGNNKTISGIRIVSDQENIGLFRGINGGSVTNLTIKDVNISASYYVGALAGRIYEGLIENVKLEGDINLNSKNDYAGGIAPECENTTFRNIKITGKVNISGKFGVGGLVGRLYNCKISKCCVDSPEGLVKGNNTVGGLLGMPNLAEIDTSYAYINVEGNHDVGGLLGRFYGPSLTNCYSDCKITVNDSNNNNYYIGGLVGYTYSENGTINNCYASGTINLNCSLAKSVGTIIGFYSKLSSINNSFSTVNIKVTDTYSYNNSNNDNFNPDVAGTSLWYKFDYDLYDGEYVFDSNGTNYCNSGYKNTLEWNTAYWFNLSDGSFPKLIGLPNR